MSARAKPDRERLRRINVLLESALSLPVTERDAWLNGLPAEQHDMVPLLRSLLARAEVETDDFMRRPPGLLIDDLAHDDEAPDRPGDQVGPYRLIRELGAGGMATVWLAERADGSLQRQVALKLPGAAWALGLARRMARERDILASLEHPLIARLYDAGVTEAGRPWLAMECVSGVPIDVHCREHKLDVPARLRLFLQVADAVAHAHARLIVHRDLKPSNILVTEAGEVRLLDFGVAKLIDQDRPAAPNLTQLLGRAITPDYASPEQVRGQAVTVATDVYSLGVVLYELLTGERPYRLGRHSAAALEEAILAAPVPPASSRVADRRLARELRGDLDNVLDKALRKDAAQRYPSVESMAADLRRHLEGEPVLAQPPGTVYRLGKFVRRHRLPLAAASAVLLALLVGLGAALWQARAARAEAARAEQVKRFVASIFEQAAPRQGIGGAPSASELLASAAERIERELASQPRVAAELGVIVGRGFSALGEPEKGRAALQAAVRRAEAEFGRRHPLTVEGKMLLVESVDTQDLPAAEKLLAEIVPDAIAGLPDTAVEAVNALRQQSFVLAKRDLAEESYAALNRAIEIGDKYLGPQHEATIEALGLLSNTYGRFAARTEQLRVATEAERRAQAAFGDKRPHTLLVAVERWYGEALRGNDRPGDAVPILRRVLQDQAALDTTKTPRVRNAMIQLAQALAGVGRLDEALALSAESMALEAAQNPLDSDDRVGYVGIHAQMLMQARRSDEAWPLHQRVVELDRRLGGRSDAGHVVDGIRESRLLAMRGDGAGAERAALEAADYAAANFPAFVPDAWAAAAFNARLQRRPQQALEFAQRAQPLVAAQPQRPSLAAAVATELGCAWLELGDTAQAARALAQASEAHSQAQAEPSARMADTLVCQARLQAGRAAEAERLLQPLLRSWEAVNPGSEWHGETLHWLTKAQQARGAAGEALRAQREQAAALLRTAREPSLRQLIAEAR